MAKAKDKKTGTKAQESASKDQSGTDSVSLTTGGGVIAADSYLVPDLKTGQCHEHEIVIKRSRFITSIGHTSSVEEAKDFIAMITERYADARHNCFAFNATAPNSTAFCGCSDDGEPKGTAGQPMLNVVLHCGVGELTAVVTRYFGGILLGTGGLVKAYQGSVKEALETLPTCERMIAAYLSIGLEHRYLPKLMHILPRYRASVEKENFAEIAYLDLRLPQHEAEPLLRELSDLTKGGLRVIAQR